MVRKVRLPNGKIGNFPDDMADADIESVLQKQFPSEFEENKESFGQKALRYGVKDPLVGIANLGHGILNAPHNLADLLSGRLANHIPKQEEYNYSEALGIPDEKKNLIDKFIQFAPELGAAFSVPETEIAPAIKAISKIPEAGKYLKAALENRYVKKGLGNALSQGAFAASQSPENQGTAALEAGGIAGPFSALSEGVLSGSPTLRHLSRLAMGAGGAGLGYFGAKGLGANEPVSDLAAALMGIGASRGKLNRLVPEDVLKGVEGSNYQDALDAANRLGLKYITPAEASANPFTGGVQGNLGKTEQGARMLYKAGQERSASERESINNLLKNVFNEEKLAPQKSELYKSAEPKEIPKEDLARLKSDEIFKEALQQVRKKPAYKESLRGVPENSIEYLNKVKIAMDDMIDSAPEGEAKIIRQHKNDFIKILDKAAPEYKQARQLAERGFVREKIEDVFNKAPLGGEAMTGTNFAKFLNNEKNYDELQNKLKRLEEESSDPEHIKDIKKSQQQLKDMRLVFNRLINIPTAKTAETLSRTSMSKGRAPLEEVQRRLKEVFSFGNYDKAAVELITNPHWNKELANLNKVTNTDKLIGAFHKLISKAGAQAVGQQ